MNQTIISEKEKQRVRAELKKTGNRLVDTFISIHDISSPSSQVNSDVPLYVSEIRTRQMNPYFTEFDLSRLKSHNTSKVKVMIWCKKNEGFVTNDDWILLTSLTIHLSQLIFLGESIESHRFKNDDNIIVIELTDGFYLLPTQFNPIYRHIEQDEPIKNSPHSKRSSASFDQLMKLNNLQKCLKDSEINKSLISLKISKELSNEHRSRLKGSIQSLEIKIRSLRKHNEVTKSDILNREKSIQELKNRIKRIKFEISNLSKFIEQNQESYGTVLNDLKMVEQNLKFEKVRVINTLKYIFPIKPLNSHSNEFLILDHHMPLSIQKKVNSSTKTKVLEIAFVLNLISQIVNILSYYLAIPLRFPVETFGSNCYINDQISELNTTMFPLWLNNLHNIEKFEYGLLLLNKNIEQMLESIGMRVIDHRNLLGNLNILLICLSDNDDENETGINNELIKKRIQQVRRKKSKLILRSQQQKQHHEQLAL